jgi:hypothetical protein
MKEHHLMKYDKDVSALTGLDCGKYTISNELTPVSAIGIEYHELNQMSTIQVSNETLPIRPPSDSEILATLRELFERESQRPPLKQKQTHRWITKAGILREPKNDTLGTLVGLAPDSDLEAAYLDHEFTEMYSLFGVSKVDSAILFHSLDKNHDGSLSLTEFLNGVHALPEPPDS